MKPMLLLLAWLALPIVASAQLVFTTNSGAITITGYTGAPTTLDIPATTNGFKVVSIATDAFYGATTVTSATIGSNVTSLGYEAFGSCSGLTSLIIPKGVTNVGQYEFLGCSSLTNVTLPNGLGKIQTETFGNCSALATIIIPASVTNFGSAVFDNCSSLTSIYFEGNAPVPGANMFSGVDTLSARVYYYAGTTGWSATYDGLTTVALIAGPEISNVAVQENIFGFTGNGTNNQVIVVQACTNLANPIWVSLQTNTLSGTSFNFTDGQGTKFPRRFYRLRSP
jgi:hypothetical protein